MPLDQGWILCAEVLQLIYFCVACTYSQCVSGVLCVCLTNQTCEHPTFRVLNSGNAQAQTRSKHFRGFPQGTNMVRSALAPVSPVKRSTDDPISAT